MLAATIARGGARRMQQAVKDYAKVEAQQRRAVFRAARAGRTLAAKELRAAGYPSKQTKRRLSTIRGGKVGRRGARAVSDGLTALRRPVPVEFLGAREDRDSDVVVVRRWPTARGAGTEQFQPAREGDNGGRFYALLRGRWRRLVGQSVARVWVGLHERVRARMVQTYRQHMATWIAGVRRRAGARS